MKKLLTLIIILSTISYTINAQQKGGGAKKTAKTNTPADTTHPGTVIVTSAFKPSLRSTAKVNFNAVNPLPDTTRHILEYNVPAQNLFFSYQPIPLKPLALYIDTSINWQNKHYIKAGFGNFSTPYVQGGFSFGDGKNSVINVHALHTSSKGSLPFQQFSKTHADVIGIFNSGNNEWLGKVFVDNRTQYQYGFLPNTLSFTKNELLNRFTNIGAKLGIRNKAVNAFGINYNPSIQFDVFTDNRNGKENNFLLNAPVSKTIGRLFTFNLALVADLTKYTTDSASISNNLFYLTPALQFNTPNFKLNAGFTPAWDNEVFKLLPNFTVEAKLKEERFVLQAGWVGYYNKTNYRNLSEFNPYLQQPKFLRNVRLVEQYVGFKGSAANHFTYHAKASYIRFSNQPLFVNDILTGKSFELVNESSMKAIRIHSEIGYTVQEKFSLMAGTTLTQYNNLKDNAKAWGLLPLEINGSLRWEILKDVMVKSDIFFWDGSQYRNKQLESQKLDPAVDLNAGVEFGILPRLNLWVQFNNVLNNKYQRWNQYEVLGFNVVGGVVYSFGK